MADSSKDQLYQLICDNPYVSQQALAEALGLSRSAVAGHIASLTRERRLLGRAYVLPTPRTVVCLGGANVDRKLRSIAPLQMGTSNPVAQQETPGGVARNVAENLARLGLPVSLLTAVGDDAAGRALLEHAAGLGIGTGGSLRVADQVTGSYTAVLDANGSMVLAMAAMALCEALTPDYLASCRPQRAQASLMVADLNLPAASLQVLLDEARASAIPLVLVAVSAPKMARLPHDLSGLSLLVLNRDELEALAGEPLPNLRALTQACMALRARGVQDLVVTLGAEGVAHTAGGKVQRLAAPKVKVVDVTGAGDAFSAGLCWSLSQQPQDLALACRRGLALAALTLRSPASVCPDLNPNTLLELPA
ncbi:MAG: winged helix-turn-helix transcriptional regulator [Burkholderiaceae bacterium]|nr:winged helix-turn-helix transcriptional regulator [Burkholderiaceae bacterium]